MKKLRRICIFILCAAVLSLPVSAETVKSGEDEISVSIPKGFTVITKESLDAGENVFLDTPISKNQAIELFGKGVLLDAFSKDQTREIKVKVSSDDFSAGIVNLSPLEDEEQREILETLTGGLGATAYTTVLSKGIEKQAGYTFLKYTVRIGDSEKGYCYTNLMTVIGGRYYEITCYNSVGVLSEEQIAENDKVFGSLKLGIKNNNGEITTNLVTTVFTILTLAAALVLAVWVLVSFGKMLYEKKKAPEHVTLQKRD